jgi:hypothetical protein
MIMRRTLFAGFAGAVLSLLVASSVLAFECTNLSKGPAAGAQLIFGANDEVLYISNGLERRLEQGLVDFETGEGFHGLIAFDIDGDGVADASTYIGVGPDGEIPLEAQFRGPACRGLSNLGIFFTQCL